MKFEQQRLISYASNFVSYLIKKVDVRELDKINAIYLFGSIARGDIRKNSDVDIFIETPIEIQGLERVKEAFYRTVDFSKWRKIGISNEINLIAGQLKDWKLKSAIESNGIILFGYQKPSKYVKWQLINWSAPKEAKKRVELQRKIFGYWGRDKKYEGIIEKEGWIRINSGAVLVRKADQILDVLHSLKIRYEIRDVYLKQ